MSNSESQEPRSDRRDLSRGQARSERARDAAIELRSRSCRVSVAVLHLINHSPWESDSLQSCLRLASTGSAILLYENGVYAALCDTAMSARVTESRERLRWYVLEPDLAARGIETERLMAGIELIDYHGFVKRVTEHRPIQSWL